MSSVGLLRLLAPCLLVLAGCVTEGPPRRQPPPPLPPQPAGLVVDRVVFFVEQPPDDADRNGYFDSYRVRVYLFDNEYLASIEAAGTFQFNLTDRAGKELASWNLEAKNGELLNGPMDPGPGCRFRLNMLEAAGTDHTYQTEALLSCAFTRDDGRIIKALGQLTVLTGSTR